MEHQPRTSRLPAETARAVADARLSTTGVHQPDPAPVDPGVAGTLLGGRYRIGDCIGSGAMGVVWTAWDRRLRRTVAIKQLALRSRADGADPAEEQLARVRAMREGRIAARVVHPRAIAVFDVVVADSAPWLVMEYLPSRSLAAVLAEQGPLAPAEAARVGAQIADALAAVHDAGIVHGDVKPGNVLITDDGVAKITDFGVSRASWDTTATGGGTVAGTPGYFAPEVARGQEPTPASDVFSLGATLYAAVENELVCGSMDNTLAVLHAMAEGRLRPAARAGVLGRPLAAMLRLDPAHRPDVRAVEQALRARAGAVPAPRALPTDASDPAAATADAPDLPAPRDETDAEPERDPRPVLTGADPAVPAPRASGPAASAVGPGSAAAASSAADPRPAATGAPAHPLVSGPLGPPTFGPAARSGSASRQRPARHRRRTVAVAALAGVALAAGVGVAVATVAAPSARPVAAPAPPAVTVTSDPTAPTDPLVAGNEDGADAGTPTTPTTPTTTPRVAAPLSPSDPPVPAAPGATPGDPGATVVDYYASLPGDIDGAWAVLSDDARADSGGYDGYREFWSRIRSVSANNVDVDGSTVRADIEFTTSSGRTTRESYRFEVTRDEAGRLVIQHAQRSSSSM